MRFLRSAAFLLAVALTTFPAAANPTTDMAAMARAYSHVKSWHSEVHSGGQTFTIDAIKPDKFHEVTPSMEVVSIGPDIWIKQGHWIKLPYKVPAMTSAMDSTNLQNSYDPAKQKDYTLTFVGNEQLNGAAARHYRIVSKKSAQPIEMWIGQNDLPMQVQMQTSRGLMTILYSMWNAVPDITPPV